MEADAETFNEEHFSDVEQAEAAIRLEEWRNNHENWTEINMVEKEEEQGDAVVQPEKKKRKREVEEVDERAVVIANDKEDFFKSRVDDFKLFISRRIPPSNPTAQEYLTKFMAVSYSEFAKELLNKVAMLQMIGALNMVFGQMCVKCAMKEEEFVDRSLERPDLDTPSAHLEQLRREILDFNTQLKELVLLAKELKNSFISK